MIPALSARKVDPAQVVGHWSGQGTILDIAFQRQHGTLPFDPTMRQGWVEVAKKPAQ